MRAEFGKTPSNLLRAIASESAITVVKESVADYSMWKEGGRQERSAMLKAATQCLSLGRVGASTYICCLALAVTCKGGTRDGC